MNRMYRIKPLNFIEIEHDIRAKSIDGFYKIERRNGRFFIFRCQYDNEDIKISLGNFFNLQDAKKSCQDDMILRMNRFLNEIK